MDHSFVTEGEMVKKGQNIIQIVNDQSVLMKNNSALNLELARENLSGKSAVIKELEKELETVKLNLNNDSLIFFRKKRLWEQGIGSQVEFDTYQLNYERTANNYQVLNKKLKRTKKELQTLLKQAENNYESSLTSLNEFTIKSEINGKMYELFLEPGELVGMQQPIASIGSADDFIIEMLIDEVDIVSIKKEQLALITLDAYKGEVFKAKISRIYPSKNERTQTFKVEGTFIDVPETLYPGLSGEANIIIRQKENVLTIPLDYLLDENKVETENGLVEVTTGLKNMSDIEIVTGLDTNNIIYKPAP